MSAAAEFPRATKAEVFVRLAEGLQAGVTVVTPNRRLALALKREFDDAQAGRGLAVWESADVLPFDAFVARAHQDALYSDSVTAVPLLLTPAQEQQLWEEAIDASEWGGVLLATARTAGQCREAWQLAYAWRIAGALGAWDGNEDAQAFAAWSRAYAQRCARDGNTDAARLPDVVMALLQQKLLRKPKLLVAFAFDILTSQQRDYFAACEQAGVEVRACGPAQRTASPRRLACASASEELERAAKWARARLEAGADVRIGIVVPDLDRRRKEVMHIFSRVLVPGWNPPGAEPALPYFNVSLGIPLTEYPLVHAALAILELAHGETEFAVASRLIRSPFVAGADSEMTQRARLDAALRKRAPVRLTLPKLLGLIESAGADCPLLAQRLGALFAYAKEHVAGSRSPQDRARQFSALLEAVGFPGDRALDSNEFQTRAKFHDTLGEFARLERVAPRFTYAQALARLRRLCADTLFEPESGAAPIQVLGIFEAAGLEFDHLWVSGLTDEAWPLAARPNPFIPAALQKKAGIPQAAVELSLARDKYITGAWFGAAGEVLVSYPLREKDRDLVMSPLIAAVPAGTWEALAVPDRPRYRDVIHRARALESVVDGVAPALFVTAVRGGSRVLADQAACPFRAFARHRLGAQPMEMPAPGLNAADRGMLVHALLRFIWDRLKSKAALDSIPPGELDEVIENAAVAAIVEVSEKRPGVLVGRFAQLERERLAGLAREWLAVEKQRPNFEVVASEDQRELEVAGLSFRGRIDRLDRLAGDAGAGGYALIDYKTGSASVADWLGERPDDPQLPLYAINAHEDIAAVVFAKLRVGAMKFDGLARGEKLVPGVATLGKSRIKLAKRYASWNELVAGWKQELEALGRGFASGDARVAPKRLFKTCEYCDLQPLCRVHERASSFDREEEEEAE